MSSRIALLSIEHTTGFDALRSAASALTWAELEAGSGLPRRSMEEFAALIANARTAVFVWSMGITQHTHGGDAVQMILNLGLLKGFVGRDEVRADADTRALRRSGRSRNGCVCNGATGRQTGNARERRCALGGLRHFDVPDSRRTFRRRR